MNEKHNKRPLVRLPFVLLILAGVIVVWLAVILPGSPLMWSIEKNTERKKIYALAYARIEAAGGWQAVETASLNLSTNAVNGFFISRGLDKSLSPVLFKLQPREIYMSPNPDGVPVMRVQLFGVHRTGYFDAPYFGIWVICTNVSTNYIPPIDQHKHGMAGEIERKGASIFEVR